jgi:hypothetical protein
MKGTPRECQDGDFSLTSRDDGRAKEHFFRGSDVAVFQPFAFRVLGRPGSNLTTSNAGNYESAITLPADK